MDVTGGKSLEEGKKSGCGCQDMIAIGGEKKATGYQSVTQQWETDSEQLSLRVKLSVAMPLEQLEQSSNVASQ